MNPTPKRGERIAGGAAEIAKFFNELPYWDGVPRVDRWLVLYAGAADTVHVQDIGRRFLLGAASRASRPGTPCGPLLVLAGPPGCGKSRLLEVLGGEFHGQSQGCTSTDAHILACSALLAEIPELANLHPELLKDFISKPDSVLRPAYGKARIKVPRTASFCATAHGVLEAPPLHRLAVVRVGTCLPELLASYRTQLWSEAAQRVASGEGWAP